MGLKENIKNDNSEGQPTPQNYYKVKNIPYGKIMYFLDKEVCAVNHTEKGSLIRIHNKGEARKHLDMGYLAREIAREIKGVIPMNVLEKILEMR